MPEVYAHLMRGDYRKGPNCRIIGSDSDNVLSYGPIDELSVLCGINGGHLIGGLSSSLIYRSSHGFFGDHLVSKHAIIRGSPEETMEETKKAIEDPWEWLERNHPDVYRKHMVMKGPPWRRREALVLPETKPFFMVELNDGRHRFIIHRSYY